MGKYQSLLMWAVMSVFLTMAGSHWVSEYGYGGGSSGNGEIMNSLIFFTLPILLTLSIASYCRVLVARRFGIGIGHIAPIVFPIPTWWAFGIVGAIGQRKLDMVPMPSRRALGSIELTVPLVLFTAGSFLTVVGLILTPSSPPQLTGPPTVFETSLISGTLADSLLGGHRDIRLQWLHPVGISGVGLSLGWLDNDAPNTRSTGRQATPCNYRSSENEERKYSDIGIPSCTLLHGSGFRYGQMDSVGLPRLCCYMAAFQSR